MIQKADIGAIVKDVTIQELDTGRNLKFGKDNSFQMEIRDRVEEYFRSTGRRQRDCPQMYLKTAILLAGFAGLYILLVVVARTWWQALPLAFLLGLSTAAIGFNVQHDGGHQAYSNFPWVNKVMAMTLDLVGASSYLWHWKHGVFHHTYVNITGEDPDIDLGIVGRQTPYQRSFGFHRWQHIYLWPLYGFMAIKWHLYDDFRDVITGRIGDHRIPRPRGRDLVIFLLGKITFFTLVFVIPVLFHPMWVVLLYYGATSVLLGIVLSVVFQLAHTVEQAEFPLPGGGTGSIENAWAVHQVETTVDFSRHSRMAAWLLGGLNFQIEHHLFPRICHVNYPAISRLVEETCHKFGLKYNENKSFWAGVASHFRWLRQVGIAQDGTTR
ncbi:MAG: acyl-CoA desaturase [Acidobacteriia bacterium]|nr:acyl-CoA desaturase [Terriglobia bacterium]